MYIDRSTDSPSQLSLQFLPLPTSSCVRSHFAGVYCQSSCQPSRVGESWFFSSYRQCCWQRQSKKQISEGSNGREERRESNDNAWRQGCSDKAATKDLLQQLLALGTPLEKVQKQFLNIPQMKTFAELSKHPNWKALDKYERMQWQKLK